VNINSKEDLTKYEVAKVLGVQHTDNITQGMPANQLTDMGETEKAMMAVLKGRANVALTNATDGLLVIERAGFDEVVPINAPLAVLDLYTYIHKSKADIVPLLDATIKEM
jgi:ABC-type amino acid transport substrate-binding protein